MQQWLTERSIQEEINPLRLSTILQKIMHYLPYEDLKNARAVCSIWKTNAAGLFRENSLISFHNISELEAFCTHSRMQSSELQNYRFGTGLKMSSGTVKDFLEEFGPLVRSLHFENCDWTSTGELFRMSLETYLPQLEELRIELTNAFQVSDFIHANNHLRVQLPKLQDLTIDFPVFDSSQSYIVGIREFMTKLLFYSPNIESVSQCSEHYEESYFSKILFDLIVDSAELRLLSLRRLNLIRNVSDVHLDKLVCKRIPLQYLCLIVSENLFFFYNSLSSFLFSLENSLVGLKLTFDHATGSEYSIISIIRHLKRLQYLTLEGYSGPIDCVHKLLPSLKVLTLTVNSAPKL